MAKIKKRQLMFTSHKGYDEIKKDVEASGNQFIDHEYLVNGSDYVTFGFCHGKKIVTVIYSTVNGHFIVSDSSKMITEASTEMESVLWYRALLRFIYKGEI